MVRNILHIASWTPLILLAIWGCSTSTKTTPLESVDSSDVPDVMSSPVRSDATDVGPASDVDNTLDNTFVCQATTGFPALAMTCPLPIDTVIDCDASCAYDCLDLEGVPTCQTRLDVGDGAVLINTPDERIVVARPRSDGRYDVIELVDGSTTLRFVSDAPVYFASEIDGVWFYAMLPDADPMDARWHIMRAGETHTLVTDDVVQMLGFVDNKAYWMGEYGFYRTHVFSGEDVRFIDSIIRAVPDVTFASRPVSMTYDDHFIYILQGSIFTIERNNPVRIERRLATSEDLPPQGRFSHIALSEDPDDPYLWAAFVKEFYHGIARIPKDGGPLTIYMDLGMALDNGGIEGLFIHDHQLWLATQGSLHAFPLPDDWRDCTGLKLCDETMVRQREDPSVFLRQHAYHTASFSFDEHPTGQLSSVNAGRLFWSSRTLTQDGSEQFGVFSVPLP